MIDYFTRHRLASHLLYLMLLLGGFYAAKKINIQLIPEIKIPYIQISAFWPKHTAEDVEKSITEPIAQQLSSNSLEFISSLTSTASTGNAFVLIGLEANEQADQRLETIRDAVEQAQIPNDVKITTSALTPKEIVVRLQMQHPNQKRLIEVTEAAQADLQKNALNNLVVTPWLPPHLTASFSLDEIIALKKPLSSVAANLRSQFSDEAMATVSQDFRALGIQAKSIDWRQQSLDKLIINTESGPLPLLSTAKLQTKIPKNERQIRHNGKPISLIEVFRLGSEDTLTISQKFHDWLETFQTQYKDIHFKVVDEMWVFVSQRLGLLLKNGIGGLILVGILLTLFLGRRTSLWVAMSIPACFLGALCVLQLTGGSLNMISMFAFIMSLGIIVDDSIVVAEQITQNREQKMDPQQASHLGAKKMFPPVLASSLTTIAAFLPLLLVSGVMGTFLHEIPTVVICVIIISLVECFLILPGHLAKVSTLETKTTSSSSKLQNIRDRYFMPVAQSACQYKGLTVFFSLCFLVVSVSLTASGRIAFNFFPNISGNEVYANLDFGPKTSPELRQDASDKIEAALWSIPNSEQWLRSSTVFIGTHLYERNQSANSKYAAIRAELTPDESRTVKNTDIIASWLRAIPENLPLESPPTITEPKRGPTTDKVTLRLEHNNTEQLNKASQYAMKWFQEREINMVRNSQGQWVPTLSVQLLPQALALGLTQTDIRQQIQTILNGSVVDQTPQVLGDREFRIELDDNQRKNPNVLSKLPIFHNNISYPLSHITNWNMELKPEKINSSYLTHVIDVIAELDPNKTNPQDLFTAISTDLIPKLNKDFQVKGELAGSFETQSDTLEEMKTGAILGISLIYLILAWIFSSWRMPLVVMSIIPFAIIGSFWGHWLLGYSMSLLSLFGVFALCGIVVNDSIILLDAFKTNLKTLNVHDAMIQAIRQRFRAVLLTTLTTVGGLTPLLFETSTQARVLIPSAITIVFGLLFSLIWILFLVPAITLMQTRYFERHHLLV